MADNVRTRRDRGTTGATSAPGLYRAEAMVGSAQPRQAEPSYYDISLLKAPLWKWEIASYFFLGGLSAGAYLLGRVAERAGGGAFNEISKISSTVALASLAPCPPLLIHDLGDPKRFHHMLRVWKPSSPMNLGTWTLVAYSGMVAFEVARNYIDSAGTALAPELRKKLSAVMNNSVLLLVHDAAGIPFALLLAGYTGVLLSTTANPLWCRNKWLGPLFSASAIATGAEAINLALSLKSRSSQTLSQSTLNVVDSIAHGVELACMNRFMAEAGEKAKTLTSGKQHANHQFSTAAIVSAELIKYLPLGGQAKRWARVLSSVLGLAGGFALRWSMVFGGHEAANDPRTARLASQPKSDAYNSSRRLGGGGEVGGETGEATGRLGIR